MFRFQRDTPDWDNAVEASFPRGLTLTTPWRWRRDEANSLLGDWIADARVAIEKKVVLDLQDKRIRLVPISGPAEWHKPAYDACMSVANGEGTAVFIAKWRPESQQLAGMTHGRFQCVEPIEAKEWAPELVKLGQASPTQRPALLLALAEQLSVGLPNHRAALIKGLTATTLDSGPQKPALQRLREVAGGGTPMVIADALYQLTMLPGVAVHRRELLWATMDALKDLGDGPVEGLSAAYRQRRNLTSHLGRRLTRCTAGTTLLVKGMEFDHAVVLHTGGPRGFTPNDLYVALTRAAKSLTVIAVSGSIEVARLPS